MSYSYKSKNLSIPRIHEKMKFFKETYHDLNKLDQIIDSLLDPEITLIKNTLDNKYDTKCSLLVEISQTLQSSKESKTTFFIKEFPSNDLQQESNETRKKITSQNDMPQKQSVNRRLKEYLMSTLEKENYYKGKYSLDNNFNKIKNQASILKGNFRRKALLDVEVPNKSEPYQKLCQHLAGKI